MPHHLIDEYERRQRRPVSVGDAVFWFLLGLMVVLVTGITLALAFHVVERVAVETAQADRIGRY